MENCITSVNSSISKWFQHVYIFVQVNFYVRVKAIYTLGHSVSLIALTTGSIILCLFRYVFFTSKYAQ